MAPGASMVNVCTGTTGKISTRNIGYTKGAFVTFLAGNGDYVKGVVGLAKGLRKVKSAYPLVVAILPDVPEEHREILRSQGCVVHEIEPIYPPENQVQFAMAYYVINYSKLRIWNFQEYSKMVYLDADIQVYENIDHLFDTPDGYFYAVMDCFCEKTWSHSPQYSIGYCQQCPDKVTWPTEMGSPPPLYFNAGMFVFEPSRLTYESLLQTLKITTPTPFAEQDFLNMFFQHMYKPIPLVYNLVLAMLWRHPENVELEKVKVVHYCAAGSKPWRYTGQEANMDREDIKMLVSKWWDVYNDESLDFKDFLNMFFQHMYKPIPLVYNRVLAMLWRHSENVELEKVKVVHYCAAGSKPWRYTGQEANMDREDIKMLVSKWWDVYNDESLDFKDFLNMFFQHMYKPIPLVYNLVLAMLWRHPENVKLEKVKVVHYCAAGSKPWRYTGQEANMDREDIKILVSKWWDVYNDESLDFKVEDLVSEGETFSRPSIMASMPEHTIYYIPASSSA